MCVLTAWNCDRGVPLPSSNPHELKQKSVGEMPTPQSKEERNQPLNSFMNSSAWGTHPMMQMPMVAIFAEMNGKLLESATTAQKEWADFLHLRIKEDVAVSRRLCGALWAFPGS